MALSQELIEILGSLKQNPMKISLLKAAMKIMKDGAKIKELLDYMAENKCGCCELRNHCVLPLIWKMIEKSQSAPRSCPYCEGSCGFVQDPGQCGCLRKL